ncbi:hypothetical protein Taro_050230 [Colocasia esculenta]|uniref:Uncharacterized protein n=1 Tax=Colocasia esculenta TaxID=4460 RepID=A0A843XDA3_COLES|nr:hypothetical protein [Colocasia esculenta]
MDLLLISKASIMNSSSSSLLLLPHGGAPLLPFWMQEIFPTLLFFWKSPSSPKLLEYKDHRRSVSTHRQTVSTPLATASELASRRDNECRHTGRLCRHHWLQLVH